MATLGDAATLADSRYSRGAMWFHWIIAALIIANLCLGFFHEGFGREAGRSMIFFHKSTGVTILALSVARLSWRLGHKPPAFPPEMARWEVIGARTGHYLFYVLMIVLPLSGWIMTSASGRPASFFGLFSLGNLPVPRSDELHEFWEEVHKLLGFTMLGLLVIHLAGALKHVLDGHAHMLGRMAPWLYRNR
jgi:cytochrome b561